jgi:transposase
MLYFDCPPYHPEPSPTEKLWAMVKNWVAMKNIAFQLQDIQKLAGEKFSSILKKSGCQCVNMNKKWKTYTSKINTLWTTLLNW